MRISDQEMEGERSREEKGERIHHEKNITSSHEMLASFYLCKLQTFMMMVSFIHTQKEEAMNERSE